MKEPSVLTRMRLSCCWGDNLNEKELNEVVDYINYLQRENQQLKSTLEEVREKLYIWGEVLHPEFQQELLQIIDKGVNNE